VSARPVSTGFVRAGAGRVLPGLLGLLLAALMISISAAEVLVALVVAAAVIHLLDPDARARWRTPLAAPFVAFALVTLLSAARADDPVGALVESKRLLAIPIFFVAVNALEGSPGTLRALRWLFAGVTVASLFALVQTGVCWSHPHLSPRVAWLLKVRPDACASGFFRAKGFFSIYMTLGGSLLVSLSLLAALLAEPGRRWSVTLTLPAVTAALALAFTYARNAWAGLAAAVVILAGATRRLVMLVPIVVVVVLVLAVPSQLASRARSALDPADPTVRERFYFWEAGLRMVQDAPLLGLGPGGVRRHYPDYKDPAGIRARTGHLHNNLVQIAAERGVLGLIAWLWIWVAFFGGAGRIYRRLPGHAVEARAITAGSLAAVGGFLVAGLFEYNFGDTEVIDLVWIVMALPFACAHEPDPGRLEPDASALTHR
jgi:hypothetical protein